jgi:hypothetical protein
MTDPIPEKELELGGTLAAHGFLIETSFSVICELHPQGKHGAFQIPSVTGTTTIAYSFLKFPTRLRRKGRLSRAAIEPTVILA